MGRRKWSDASFGKRVQIERTNRGWSQAELARMLSENGVNPMHPTTIAKIESGQRSVRINEAVGIADLFEASLDSLLGRKPGTQINELEYSLRLLRDTSRQSSQQVFTAMETIREQLDDLPKGFANADDLQKLGRRTWSKSLYLAHEALMLLAELSEALLHREQGRPQVSDEGLMELTVESIMELEAHEDAAQS